MVFFGSEESAIIPDINIMATTRDFDKKISKVFATRLSALLDARGFPVNMPDRFEALALMFNVSEQAARKWLEGKSVPACGRLISIAIRLDCSIDWLLGHQPSSTPELSERQPEIADLHTSLFASSEWAQNLTPPLGCDLLPVTGISMEPTLRRGDTMVVDLTLDRIEDNEIYVIERGGDYIVRRLQISMNGHEVIVKCDNPKHEREVLKVDNDHIRFVGSGSERIEGGLNILGRVFWAIKKI